MFTGEKTTRVVFSSLVLHSPIARRRTAGAHSLKLGLMQGLEDCSLHHAIALHSYTTKESFAHINAQQKHRRVLSGMQLARLHSSNSVPSLGRVSIIFAAS